MKVVLDSYGMVLPCCWDDCTLPGFNEIQARTRDTEMITGPLGLPMQVQRVVRYVFCSERHRAYWTNSVHSNGNLPTGMKGKLL